MEFSHIPVLLDECITGLNIKSDGIYVDGTAGGAGHSLEIAKKLSDNGLLIGIDRDPDAVKAASDRLAGYNAKVVRNNYSNIKAVLSGLGVNAVDGVLLDLGVSSHQLDTAGRGFSYHNAGPLDMRMSREGLSAKDVLNNYPEEELSRILFEFGEEKYSRKIAANIVKFRLQQPLETTLQLADIIRDSIPAAVRREKNPCKKTFQAIRIEVNGELEHLSKGLDDAFECLDKNGRLAVITFHSLEDRLVKQRFAAWCQGCICPPEFPVCICNNKPKARLITRKPIEASADEIEKSNRSRSAKLRIIERI